jgi:hypothetical protein
MALILDTDHLSEFDRGSEAGERLRNRLIASGENVSVTVISAEEQLRGWLAQIHRANNDPAGQVIFYQRLLGACNSSQSGRCFRGLNQARSYF